MQYNKLNRVLLLFILSLISIATYSQSEEAYMQSGKEKMRLKDIEGALSDFSQVVRMNPKNELAFVNRALIRMAQGKWEQAIPDCNSALKLNPQQAVAYFVRGCAKANTGKNGCDDLYKSLNLGYAMAQKGIKQFCN